MDTGLAYFKKVYDEVPGWVQKMHDFSPEVLSHYTRIRSEIMKDGALTRKEKDVLIASMNAARLYPRSMLYHTKGAVDNGITIPELVEYFLVAYLYKGIESLKLSIKALAYALELKGKCYESKTTEVVTLDDIFHIIIQYMDNEDTSFVREVFQNIQTGDRERIERKILEDGNVSSRLKYLNMVGNFITELNGKGASSWIKKARNFGASEADLADVGYICILTAGIPAWFEISDSL
ncbi:carboxymuconolactone decarboxylase family protein [Tuberibacillus calidus]|jgi:alkylhydroperoxidase/carboxymuconolactone decarboxylase family protein YurZ|uniref:carboxymuconolactone decarboxylase family protein n=1 Tax=Tuberibacillus calidus TaxID=340097 RepID=UPI00041BE59F|nr:carboxymuconolactone decarboxylase family protein [Tuberibacillus calidus]